jgi:hypothetical protein
MADDEPRLAEDVRRGEGSSAISRDEFQRRFEARFHDPAFEAVATERDRVAEVAWDAYHAYRKSPRTRPAGSGVSDPAHPIPVEWLEARQAIADAAARHDSRRSPSTILPSVWSPPHARRSKRPA